jgi:hypothetical protein
VYGIKLTPGWRLLDFRNPVGGETYLTSTGYQVTKAKFDTSFTTAAPILERIEEWVTPTDEDSKHRPMVQVRDSQRNGWSLVELELVAVVGSLFHCKDNGGLVARNYCRMKKEVEQ